ncbi:MAG: hypothetical protein KatS3mg114_0745 [Planctomycetaceae bacterium]|nr:MAG: hypothetical protein KatS3mg114_0745 [Planctomycetaceae bacterium]
MSRQRHALRGCRPTPLASYLKALGVLRVVGAQADPEARGWWEEDCFYLLTKLSRSELEQFFLDNYVPTPIVAPWNVCSGFYPKDNKKYLDALLQSLAPRFQEYRDAIRQTQRFVGDSAKLNKKDKSAFIAQLQKMWRGRRREWLDAVAIVSREEGVVFPSLLGTGGNDGRLDFTQNFMMHLGKLFDLDHPLGKPADSACSLLRQTLWGENIPSLQDAAIGQFDPGLAGGANSTSGFDSDGRVNSWDYMLMLEGCMLFRCAVTRHVSVGLSTRASTPFALQSHAAGFATAGSDKSKDSRGEQWLPLWNQPTSLDELRKFFGEARLQLGRSVVVRPLDAARAISRLGVSRGIRQFVRYGYLKRNGRSFLAVPLGKLQVQYRSQAGLVDDLAAWVESVGRLARDKHATARWQQAERLLSDALYAALTHDETPDRWQLVLRSAVRIERLQAAGGEKDAARIGPIPRLRPDWLLACDDGSVEFRLARTLGSAAAAYRRDLKSSMLIRIEDPIRHHWLPLKDGARWFLTHEQGGLRRDPRVVMHGRDLIDDLIHVVERRMLEAEQSGKRHLPLEAALGAEASLSDLAEFLLGGLDETKLLELSLAFMAVEWDKWEGTHGLQANPARCTPADGLPDEGWLAIRLCHLAWPLDREREIPTVSQLVRWLATGDVPRAVALSRLRLLRAGIRSPVYTGSVPLEIARRWAAALAFPISRATAVRCESLLQPPVSIKTSS